MKLPDKRKTVFVNLNGKRDTVPEKTANLLEYLKTGNPQDSFTEDLQNRVELLRDDTEWRDNYMTLEMKMDLKYEQGLSEGLKTGREQGLNDGLKLGISQLINKKLANGKSVSQIAEDLDMTEDEIETYLTKDNIQ